MAGTVQRITEVSRRPKSLGQVPDGAVSLAMGEPAQDTGSHVVEAAVAALRAGRTRYAPLSGLPALQEAIAEHLAARHSGAFTANEIVVTHGASAGLAASVLAVVGPGDRVVIPEPTYSLYADQVALAGGVPDWVPNLPDGGIDVDSVLRALDGARLLVLCSPSNPTGRVVDEDVLRMLSDGAAAADCLVLCDEAYSDILFDGRSFFSCLDIEDRSHIICARTFSKSYAMTGWRLGYVVAANEIAGGINLVHRTFAGALATFVQDAGIAALGTDDETLRQQSAEYEHRRNLVLEMLGGLPGVEVLPPQGAFYAFVRVETDMTADELTQMCAARGVLVRSGTEYGPSGEHAFRLSFATSDENLVLGLERLTDVLQAVVR